MERVSIAITGDLGSGKSTVSRLVSEILGFNLVSMGTMFREEARDRNMSVNELTELYESTGADLDFDQRLIPYRKYANIVFDARLAWLMVPETFKVYISVTEDEGIRRILGDNRDVEKFTSFEEAKENVLKRRESEIKRYNKLYNIDYLNESNYDLIIDSSNVSPQDLAIKIIEGYTEWIGKAIKVHVRNIIYNSNKYIESLDSDRSNIVYLYKDDTKYYLVGGYQLYNKQKTINGNLDARILDLMEVSRMKASN
ncbi:AAA family ATPase [Clostridium paraputrificum]|uniref:Cytidylate kinase n=1 Tax=Clostridium paraputrificum TaxID=29363 RepID=A0A6N3F304_9CLOT